MIPENLPMRGLRPETVKMLKEIRKMRRKWANDYNGKEVMKGNGNVKGSRNAVRSKANQEHS